MESGWSWIRRVRRDLLFFFPVLTRSRPPGPKNISFTEITSFLNSPLTEPYILFHSRGYVTMLPVETTTQRPVSGVPITTLGIRHPEREVFHFELMLKGITGCSFPPSLRSRR
jgi:hypothetical protein